MSTYRKICFYSSMALGAAAVAGAVWFFYRRRNRQRTPRSPVMAEWEHWKCSRKLGTLPASINDPRRIFGVRCVGENVLNPLYPDTAVIFFGTRSHIHDISDDEDEPRQTVRYTLWRHSLLRDKTTPFCSFEVPLSIHGCIVNFKIMGQHLLCSLDQGTSISVLVFSLHGEFLRKIQLEDTPLLTANMPSYFNFEYNHCHLLVVPQTRNSINSYKFHIDPVANRANCIQRNTIQVHRNKECNKTIWSFPDCMGFEVVVRGQMRDVSNPWIRYDYASGSLAMCQSEEMFSRRLVNWKHQLNLTTSLSNFEDQKSIRVYKGGHTTSTDAGSITLRQLYFVCKKEVGGEMVRECSAEKEEHPEEEEEQNSNNLNIYSLQSEPKSLKALALSTFLKNLPRVKDLPEKDMREVGIPPNIVAALEEHKRWESDPCTNLGVL